VRSMRKRRVGVTARSRQIVGNQVTGTLQFATEIAAPLELRTPMGTCGEGRNQSADGSMVTMARELTGRMQSEKSGEGKRAPGRAARCARMRRCLILRQGGKPPETPAPFPSESSFQNGGNLSRVRKPRNYSAPLTDSLRSEETTEMRERGLSAKRAASRVARGDGALRAHEALPHAPPGGKPPETPQFSLDRERASHGSRDREGASADSVAGMSSLTVAARMGASRPSTFMSRTLHPGASSDHCSTPVTPPPSGAPTHYWRYN